MQTSRFQLGLIATLAVGLGFSLASSEAIGYPSGAAVSFGANPVWSVGGQIDSSGTTVVFTAPPEQDAVITDLYITSTCFNCTPRVTIETATERLASYRYRQFRDGGSVYEAIETHPIKQTFQSGLRVPAGEAVSINLSSHSIDYTLSGYYAQP